MTKKDIIKAITFFLKYKDKWHSYGKDNKTINLICYLVDLKILNHNDFNQVKINVHNAELYLRG